MALAERSVVIRRTRIRGLMSRARPAHRWVALGAALTLAVLGAAPAQAAGPQRGTPAPRPSRQAWDQPSQDDPSRLIVTFQPGTTAVARRSAIATATAGTGVAADLPAARGILPAGRSVTVRAPAGGSASTVAALRADPRVLRVSVDHRRYRDADPTSEPYWHELWGLDNTGQEIDGVPGTAGSVDVDIDGRQALGITGGDRHVVVAVIDDGVDFSHPDLAARAWTNPGESGAGRETNGIDDDGNGYIDDVHGWDFCHDDNTVHDFNDDYHGTHVAGTIAASLNGVGIVGVAPNVSIMALKFLGAPGDQGCGLDSGAIAAIAYAKSFGVRIANNSWGADGRPSDAPELYDAIKNSGMLFVAAAGNHAANNDTNALPSLPASFDLPNIVSVAAIDNTGALAGFSNFGPKSVDIAAPGVAILSALPADATYPDPGWGWLDGTSMAVPHVSGSAALVAWRWPSVAADPIAMKSRLMHSGKVDAATAGLTVSGRVVDAYRALDSTGPIARAPTSYDFVVGSQMAWTGAATRVGWPAATDDRTGVAAYGLQVRAGSGAWSWVVGSTGSRSAVRTLTFGTAYGLRVRARDGADNWGPWTATAVSVTPSRYQETSSTIAYGGWWGRVRNVWASGGQTSYATHPGASATFRFTGRAFAMIAPKGPTRGSAKLYVDGHYISTFSLYRSTWTPRIVVAARSWPVSGAHSVNVVVVGTAGHPRIDIDAFAVLR
jgi:subtilisin family serine protease